MLGPFDPDLRVTFSETEFGLFVGEFIVLAADEDDARVQLEALRISFHRSLELSAAHEGGVGFRELEQLVAASAT